MNKKEMVEEIASIIDVHIGVADSYVCKELASNIVSAGYSKADINTSSDNELEECAFSNTCKETSPHHHLAEDNYKVMICDGKPDDSGREKICCQLGRRYCEENKMNSPEESSKSDDSNAYQLERLLNEELVNSLSYWSEQKSKGYFSFDDKLSDLASKKIKEISKEIERRML